MRLDSLVGYAHFKTANLLKTCIFIIMNFGRSSEDMMMP